MAESKYIPKLKGTLIFGSVALGLFLGTWEGKGQYTVYADKLAGGLPTVCKGITKHVTDTPIIVGDKWSPDKCEFEENRALVAVQLQLVQCFKILPPQQVFDMASSHAWNNGAGATCGSGAMQAWNSGQWLLGCKRMMVSDSGRPQWSYVKTGRIINGKPEYRFIQGLANRRQAEYRQCIEGIE